MKPVNHARAAALAASLKRNAQFSKPARCLYEIAHCRIGCDHLTIAVRSSSVMIFVAFERKDSVSTTVWSGPGIRMHYTPLAQHQRLILSALAGPLPFRKFPASRCYSTTISRRYIR